MSGTDQRDTAIYASTVDLEEAYKVGQNTALIALEHGYPEATRCQRQRGAEPHDAASGNHRVFTDVRPLSFGYWHVLNRR